MGVPVPGVPQPPLLPGEFLRGESDPRSGPASLPLRWQRLIVRYMTLRDGGE